MITSPLLSNVKSSAYLAHSY